ncbi:MAG: AsmA family protein [Proteobacteria bacterium]|nr:AsmA family protein [Pseudomonadota bacterium]
MNNGLLFLGALLVAILAALFAVPNFIDWNSYRGVFEEEASKVLGREVRVGGSVNLKFLPVPYVRFEKVRIANLTGQTGEPFVRADSFTMWLSGPALLRGVFEASQIELEKPVLTLSVDDKGVGNWTRLELRPGDLPFVPRDVALRSVQITDGAVSLYNAASERVATVDGIDGDLSADSLTGPFRFKGSVSWSGTEHEVKFATDVPGSDGAFALKLSARADRSPSVFMLDGRVSNLNDKTTFKGRWTGKIQVPGVDTGPAIGKGPPLLDLRSDVTADGLGAKIQNLALTLDNAAAPQTIDGSAVATWTASPRLDLVLNSKWLDVDWLAGAGQGSASFAKLRQLALGLMQSVAGDTTASAKINLEQVKIGGENAGGLSVDADRQGSVTHLKTFKISLPGGSRLDLAGDLKTRGGKFSFAGNGFIGGSSFGRFKAWADKSGIPLDIDADGPYSGAGKLDIDDKRLFLTAASGDISGRALAGEFKITHDDRERLDVTLQAEDLDTHQVFPKIAAALRAEFRMALGLAPKADDAQSEKELPADVRLRLIAGRLIDGNDTYRDIDVSFAMDGRKMTLPVAKLTTESGLIIGLEGGIQLRDSGPVGSVAYDVVGSTPDAMHDLVRKAGLLAIIGEERLTGLKDGKIAGLVQIGLRAPKTTDVTFNGVLNGSPLDGRAEFDGGFESWRSQPSRFMATLDSPTLSALLATLGRAADDNVGAAQPARLSVLAAGTLGSSSEAQSEISSKDFDMRFQGRAQWPDRSDLALNGSVDIKADEATDALALAGFSLPAGADGIAARGALDVRRDRGTWSIAAHDFAFGSSKFSGDVTMTSDAETGAARISGTLLADRIAVPGLLAGLSHTAAKTPPDTDANRKGEVAEATPVWPEGLFDFATLGNTNATLKVAFKSLAFRDAFATGEGTMTVALAPGKLTISDLTAAAAGGKLLGQASLEKVSNGVALAADLKVDKAELSSVNAAGRGLANADLHAEARAQSAAGLFAVMAGSGTLKLVDADVSGPSPSTAAEVVDKVLNGKVQNDPQVVAGELVSAVGTSKMALGNRDFPISLLDGSLKLGGIDLQNADGKVEGTATADLTTLDMSASFQLTSVVRPLAAPAVPLPNRKSTPPKGPLPPAIVLYDGQLGHLAATTVSADVGDLQRELIVRQMERNVEELEQARRADEERVRLEKERKKKEAADRAAAQAKAMQQLPPVIPDSAGTANSPSGANGARPDGTSDQPMNSQGPANSSDATPGNTILTPKISVEPLPPSETPNGQQSDAGQVIAIDPQTGLPVANPTPVAKPSVVRPSPAKAAQRRTSSDEVMRTLRGLP